MHGGESQMEPVRDLKLANDECLLQQVAAGDEDAKKRLIIKLWRRVNSITRRLGRDIGEAEDFAQEALLQILRSAPRYRAEGCIEAWADAITVRTVMKIRRRLYREQKLFVRLCESAQAGTAKEFRYQPTLVAAGNNAEQQLLQKALTNRMTELLSRIHPDQGLALVLKVVHGYKLEEVAKVMSRPPGKVRYLLRQGRARLRRLPSKDKELIEPLQRRVP